MRNAIKFPYIPEECPGRIYYQYNWLFAMRNITHQARRTKSICIDCGERERAYSAKFRVAL